MIFHLTLDDRTANGGRQWCLLETAHDSVFAFMRDLKERSFAYGHRLDTRLEGGVTHIHASGEAMIAERQIIDARISTFKFADDRRAAA